MLNYKSNIQSVFSAISMSYLFKYALIYIFIFTLYFISCAPSIESMRKSIDDVNSSQVYFDTIEKILFKENPTELIINNTISGELSEEDKIVFIEDVVDKSYFDIYKIQNKSIGNFQFEAQSDPLALGGHGAYLAPKLFLFKEGDEENLIVTSDFTPPDGDGAPIIAKMECQLEENTNYYLLVCSDNEHLMENIYTIHVAFYAKEFYIRNTGSYDLTMNPIIY